MIYLSSFCLPTERDENLYFDPRNNPDYNYENRRTCYNTKYPFGLFRMRELPEFVFSEVTILCGGNGSGKSTILNVIAEKLGLQRRTVFNRSPFFDDYVKLTKYRYSSFRTSLPMGSAIITSDDVFDRMLELRRLNEGIDSRRTELLDEILAEKRSAKNGAPLTLSGLDDYESFSKKSQMRDTGMSASKYVNKNLIGNVREHSNGESALQFFIDSLGNDRLYLLDEPENSLSVENQLNLKFLIEDSAKRMGCQFIISTHSPFLLSVNHAKIYDIDDIPPRVKNWTELESVRTYKDFFDEHKDEFNR